MSKMEKEWFLGASAIENFELDELLSLLEKHPGLARERGDENGNSLLHWAISEANFEAAKALLPVSSVDQADDDGDTPLMSACLLSERKTQEFFVEEILRAHPDLAAQNNRGRTALSYAILAENILTVRMIIAAREAMANGERVDGLSLGDIDHFGQNLAHIASAGRGDGLECLEFILSLPGGEAMAEAKDLEGRAPWEIGALSNKPNRRAYWRARREREELLGSTPPGPAGNALRM